jgi:hypothetical protein
VLVGLRTSAEPVPRRHRALEWAAGGAAVAFAVLIVIALLSSRLGVRSQPAGQQQAPPPRAGAAVVYDPGRHVLVLFGGRTDTGDRLADTWTWDGGRWTQRHPAVSPPALPDTAHIVYDAANGTIVLAGYPGETWTWGGRTWTRDAESGPTVGASDAMAYDPATRTVLLYRAAASRTHETWSWDGTRWSQLHPAALPDIEQGTMAYDGSQVILVGTTFLGAGAGQETWAWDGRTWSRLSPALRLPEAGVALAYDQARGRLVAFVTPADVRGVETWTWGGGTWRKEHPAHQPTSRNGAALVYDPSLHAVVLYGGVDDRSVALDDIWTWDSSDWTLRKEATR